VAGFFFAATIMAPAYGPVIDHHYAERLLFHAHLADTGPHLHIYLDFHPHLMPSDGAPDLATAIPGDDGLPSAPIGAGHNDEPALRSTLEPPVDLDLPAAYLSRSDMAGPPPPLRPPRPSA
jgi:hypothetical protein